MKTHRTLIFSIIILSAILFRIIAYVSLDRLLPLNALYVDEKTFSMSPFVQGIEGFSRPPGMFVLSMVLNASGSPLTTRIAVSFLSLLPALALYLAFRNKGGAWLFAAGLLLSPFMILYGLQVMPAVPAAVLISFTLLMAKNKKIAFAGFLTGISILFRAELALIPLFLLAFSFRKHFRKWLVFTVSAAVAVIPVIILNIFAGAGPIIASNGTENLWIGTDWKLVTTPPGTEFEELVSIGNSRSGGNSVFLERAVNSIADEPLKWLKMGVSKTIAFFTLPGPGRNLETGWVLIRTWLIVLLPLTLFGISVGTSLIFKRRKSFWQLLAFSIVFTGIASSFIFFPSARFRVAFLPAFWFLAASVTPSWKYYRLALAPAAGIIFISLLVTYPGMERSGLTSILAAEHLLDSGDYSESAEYLLESENRGFFGADLHNIRGVLLSLSGNPRRGLDEFEKALEISPDSPTLWKNYAVSLWSNTRYSESVEAAKNAVFLNPLLRDELSPILEHAENL